MLASKRNRSDQITYFAFTIIPVLLYATFYVYSMFSGFYYSFTDWNGLDPEYNFIGIKNYETLFANANFWKSMSVTFQYAVLLVICTASLSLILALGLNSLKRFKGFMKSAFFIPAMIGSVTIALIWNQLFYRALPVLGEVLGIAWLSQSPLAMPHQALYAVVLINVWQAVAMPTIIFIAGLQSIPEELYESAQLDGATTFGKFRYITFPYLLPTLTVNIVLLVKQGFTTFDYPYALTGGGPARATMVIAIQIINDAFQNWKFAMANAEAGVLFVIIAAISGIQIWLSSRGGVNDA